ncbi:MAG: hypothetical protein ACIALR_08240, partial [Blastopirellula sp. JB062]
SGNSRLIQMYSHSVQLIFNLSAVDTLDVIRFKRNQTLNDHRELHRLIVAGETNQAISLLERHMAITGGGCS